MSSPLFVPFDAFWMLVAALLVTSARIPALLRGRHRALWWELGRPGLLPQRSLGRQAALSRFYWSGRVRDLRDPQLRRWVTAHRTFQLLLAATLVRLGWMLLPT